MQPSQLSVPQQFQHSIIIPVTGNAPLQPATDSNVQPAYLSIYARALGSLMVMCGISAIILGGLSIGYKTGYPFIWNGFWSGTLVRYTICIRY